MDPNNPCYDPETNWMCEFIHTNGTITQQKKRQRTPASQPDVWPAFNSNVWAPAQKNPQWVAHDQGLPEAESKAKKANWKRRQRKKRRRKSRQIQQSVTNLCAWFANNPGVLQSITEQ